MFGGDDDDEDTGGTGTATRYPCMPSLIALQQMRNRLHLANTGKKLMKWTAMATGRELRKLAKEMDEAYQCFREDMRNCFIALARARYFMPCINQSILENVGKEASVKVYCSHRSVSGVKVIQMDIIESEYDQFAYLGIGRGGEIIQQAKKEWRDLLKRIILMLTERVSFVDLDKANRTATKKKNVLQRIVIPRTIETMRYIIEELEEMAREEFYRIKMIIANKNKLKKKKTQNVGQCAFCHSPINKPIGVTEEKEDESDTELIKMMENEFPFSVLCGECSEKYRNGLIDFDEIKNPDTKSGSIVDEEEEVYIKHTRTPSIEEILALPQKESISSSKSIKQVQDVELGTFETEIEEITKIVRTKNEDGTVTEQKRVIRKKTERRGSDTDSYDNDSNARTVGLVTLSTPSIWKVFRKTKSLDFHQPKKRSDPVQNVNLSNSLVCNAMCYSMNVIQNTATLENCHFFTLNYTSKKEFNVIKTGSSSNLTHVSNPELFQIEQKESNGKEIMNSNSFELHEYSYNSDEEI